MDDLATAGEDWRFGTITDEAIATLRSRIGTPGPMTPPSDPYSRDAIIRYLAAVGDDNPIFWDEAYAKKTRWGGVIAPPRMLLRGYNQDPVSITDPNNLRITFMGEDVLKGVFAMISGMRLVPIKPIRLGDRIRAQSAPHDVVERQSKMAGRSLELINKTTFWNQDDEEVAIAYESVIRMERGKARESRKYLDIPEAKYTDAEMAALDAQYDRERGQRRGAEKRYWDDTEVGDDLITLAKGPLTITDIVAYFLGQGAIYYTNRVKHLQLKANPSARLVNPETNVEDEWTAAHWDHYFAQNSGIPRPYDEGPMRYDNMSHLVTDWMGDDGVLHELAVQLRAPVLTGDLSWCTGKVTGKRKQDGKALVDLGLWITNQRGDRTTVGSAVVELPTKG